MILIIFGGGSYIFSKIILTCGAVGNACFVIISSWFLAEKKEIHSKKIIIILLQAVFYSFAIFIATHKFYSSDIEKNQIIKILLGPVYPYNYWFIDVYALFYLFVPIMCATIDKMNKRQRILLLVMSTLLEAWYTIFCTGGIGLHWFIYVYIVIKHIKTYNLMKRIKHPIFLPILLILFGSVFSCMGSYLDIRIGYMNFGSWNYFSFATALGMFLLFYSIKLPDCKILNWFSDKVLGVYLLHENKFLSDVGKYPLLWDGIWNISKNVSSVFFIPYTMVAVFITFLCCCIIEFARKSLIDDFIIKKFPVIDKLCGQFDRIWNFKDSKI